ncbi:hypothetical protein MMC19_007578 [Ptychographa xylographoides]|nr:hypothetical protein [Ptychographa xylographoides]
MDNEENSSVPLQDRRVFGAGLIREHVNFVPASGLSYLSTPTITAHDSSAKRYLSIVSNTKSASDAFDKADEGQQGSDKEVLPSTMDQSICEVCRLPLQMGNQVPMLPRPHEASITHQLCLAYSHPPSHLDRNHKGLKYLSSYGWDPDSRLGLGATGSGIVAPVSTKLKPKYDTAGLGVEVQKSTSAAVKYVNKLDAGKVRKQEEVAKKKGEKLREMFYDNDDVEKYLRK